MKGLVSIALLALATSQVGAQLVRRAPSPLQLRTPFQAGSGAPRSSTEGFFASVSLNGSVITADDLDDESDSGGGLALQLGYGFTRNFSLFVEATGAAMSSDEGDDYVLGHFDVGARFNFANRSRPFVPFIEAAFTGRGLAREDATVIDNGGGTRRGDIEVSGTGFTLGGGFHYFMNSKLALTAGLKWTKGEFSTIKVGSVSINDLDIDATTTRLNFGLSWFPRG